VSLADKLRTMRMARAEDGEAFGLLTSNPRVSSPVKLDLRLIEADQVATPDLTFTEPNAVDGIVFDEAGNPVIYHVLRRHPGSNGALFDLSYDQIPAESIIHFYRCDRPGQSRGIPDITPALPLFAQLRRFTLAVIAAAETAANFAGILYTDAPAGGEADPAEPFEPIQLESRALVTMPGGWRMSQLESQQPSTTYSEFKKEILNEIARCLNMPFKVGIQEAVFWITTESGPSSENTNGNNGEVAWSPRHLQRAPGRSANSGLLPDTLPSRPVGNGCSAATYNGISNDMSLCGMPRAK
jgi:capsid protein